VREVFNIEIPICLPPSGVGGFKDSQWRFKGGGDRHTIKMIWGRIAFSSVLFLSVQGFAQSRWPAAAIELQNTIDTFNSSAGNSPTNHSSPVERNDRPDEVMQKRSRLIQDALGSQSLDQSSTSPSQEKKPSTEELNK
jgi:hypothetical protein